MIEDKIMDGGTPPSQQGRKEQGTPIRRELRDKDIVIRKHGLDGLRGGGKVK